MVWVWSFERCESVKLVDLRTSICSLSRLSLLSGMARLQPDVAEHILREAPTLSETLLNGLGTWRNIYNYIYIILYYQRKWGSNTSVLRTNRNVRLDIDEGRCETWHHITIHHKRIIGYDTGWWRRAAVTREMVTKGSGETKGNGDEGKWWGREVVTLGSGDFGKWWRRECGDFGKWWLREVVTKGSGEEGKWWLREVVRKGSGDEGKWWGREVVSKGSGETKGNGDEGKWWGREVVTLGSGDEGSAVTLGSGD